MESLDDFAPRLARDFFSQNNCWASAPSWQAYIPADNDGLPAALSGLNLNPSASAPLKQAVDNAADTIDLQSANLSANKQASALDVQASTIAAEENSLHAAASVIRRQAKLNPFSNSGPLTQGHAKGNHVALLSQNIAKLHLQKIPPLLREGLPLLEASATNRVQASTPTVATPSDAALSTTPSSAVAPIHPLFLSNPPMCGNPATSTLSSSSTSHSSPATPESSSSTISSMAHKSALRASASPWTPSVKSLSVHCMLVGSIITPLPITPSSACPTTCLQLPKADKQPSAPFSLDGDHLGVGQQPRCCHHCGHPPHASPAADTPSFGCFPLRGRNEDIQAQASEVASRQPRKPFECSRRSRFKMKGKLQRLDADERDPPRPRSHLPRCKMKDEDTGPIC